MSPTDDQVRLIASRVRACFAKLYYFFPTIAPHLEKVGEHQVQVHEPLDALLWLLETLQKETGGAPVEYRKLRAVVLAWWPLNDAESYFSRRLKLLERAGCVSTERDPTDKRRVLVSLTGCGRLLLDQLIAQRTAHLDFLVAVMIETLLDEEASKALALFENMADQAWVITKDRAVLPSTTRTRAK